MAGSWPKAQVDAQRKRIVDAVAISKTHASALAVNRTLTVNAKDADLLNELVRFAIESMNATIANEETYGNRAPILDTLREYVSAASDLLARIGAGK
jgi:hypothetical protein